MLSTTLITLALCLSASARPMRRVSRRAAFDLKNGQDAIALNDQFKTLTATSACNAPRDACVHDQFAQCVGGKFVLQPCAGGTICAALPLVNSPGTSITCTTAEDLKTRIAAAAAGTATANDNSSTGNATAAVDTAPSAINNAGTGGGGAGALDPSVIGPAFASNGNPGDGQSASLTTTNNFINFCAQTLPGTPITNGQQIVGGSCNPIPIGLIPKKELMPVSKFINPPNLGTVVSKQPLDIKMNLGNLQAGNFVNATSSYFAAPQQLNKDGVIIGHTHVVVEALTSLTQTELTDPIKFIIFKGIDTAAVNGVVSVTIAGGVPTPGAYRLCSINSSSNHQPVIVPIAQHGSLDDCVCFTAT
ncbi:hypothetical protein C8R43DRAFT_1088297 [Mycena crocata]|nr:hypothetical protein C8R43DRAFT_1088297 [Mycena crocata]